MLKQPGRKPSPALLATTALFAALVTLATAYLLHIPVGTMGGYIHLGDAFIYLAACLLPMPYAMAAAALGAGLADILSGAAIWLIPTLIIKPLLVLAFARGAGKLLCRRNLLAIVISGLVGVVGYALAEAVLVGSLLAAFVGIPAGLVQAGGSALAFLAIAAAFDKANLAQRLRFLRPAETQQPPQHSHNEGEKPQ